LAIEKRRKGLAHGLEKAEEKKAKAPPLQKAQRWATLQPRKGQVFTSEWATIREAGILALG
jgi:hypothetical protein